MMSNIVKYILLLSLLIPGLSSCEKDKFDGSVEAVNEWIYRGMDKYYLWRENMPPREETNFSAPTGNYFISLLHNRYGIYGDRFSYIESREENMTKALTYGGGSDTYIDDFGFSGHIIHFTSNSQTYDAFQVLYTIPGSPADKAGIRHGHLFSKINGYPVMSSEALEIIRKNTGDIIMEQINQRAEFVSNIPIRNARYLNTPILLDTVFTFNNITNKVGYLVYNHFTAGDNDLFNNELKDVFAGFKTKGVTDLIIDLRYNPGGVMSSVQTIASMVARETDVRNKEILSRVEYNTVYSEILKESDPDFDKVKLNLSEDEISRCNLDLSSVHIITLNYTASASEVLTHCLKPFVEVKQYGIRTVGKNLGVMGITDSSNRIKWQMNIVTSKVWDRDRSPGYETGLVPDVELSESYSNLGNLGNIFTEPILAATIDNVLDGDNPFQRPARLQHLGEPVTIRKMMPVTDRGIIIDK